MRKLGYALLWVLLVIAGLLGTLMLAVMFERPAYGASPKEVYEKHKHSVVLVFAMDKAEKEFSAGGGVIVSMNTIITMNHIVPDEWTVFIVFFDGTKVLATVSARDERNDIMKLTVQNDEVLHLMRPIRLNISPPDVGETLYFIGHPAGTLYSFAQGYSMFHKERETQNGNKVLQISMTATQGSSGGALLDTQGELRGLVSMMSPDGSMVYATPSREVCNLVKCKEGR